MEETETVDSFSEKVLENMTTDIPTEEGEKTTETPPPKEDTPKPAETAEKTDPPPQDTEDAPPGGLNDEQTVNWKALRESKKKVDTELKEARARLTDLNAKLDSTSTELESSRKTFDLEEHNSLKEKVADLTNQLAEVDILRSPEVKAAQEKVKSEVANAEKSIKRILPEQDGLARILTMAPQDRERALIAMLEDAPASVSSRVWSLVDRIDDAQINADNLTESAKDKVQEWKQTQASRQESEQKERDKRASDLYLSGLQTAQSESEGFPEYFTEKEGAEFEDNNRLVRETVNFTRSTLTEPQSEEQLAQVAFLAGIGKVAPLRQKALTEALARSEAERAELITKLEAFENAAPGAGGSQGSGDTTTEVRFVDKVISEMGQ